MRRTSALVEYLVFAAPSWLQVPMGAMGLMWLIANKAQWHRIPWSVAFIVFTLAGLWALTRVAVRRYRDESAIGPFEALFLAAGLAACLWPLADVLFLHPPDSSRSALDRYLYPLLFAWPAPIYVHWLVSGLFADAHPQE